MRRPATARRPQVLAALVGVFLGYAEGTGAQPPKRPRPVENIKTLKGWNGDEVRAEMRLMTDALGVKCEHCHVQGNFASDEKRSKHTARRMLELTMGLNAEHFGGQPPAEGESKLGRVTCYTCHQGALVPKQGAGPGGLLW